MANELKHGSVGTELTQAEWEAVGAHVIDSQAEGDIVYASSSSQLSRLGKGADNTVLHLASGVPAWTATPTLTGLTVSGALTLSGDDVLHTVGADADGVLVLRSESLNADTTLAGVIVGTAKTYLTRANTLMISNVADAGGNIHILATDYANNTFSVLWGDGSGSTWINALGGQTLRLTVGTAEEYVFSTTAVDFRSNHLDNAGYLILNAVTAPAGTEVYAAHDNTGDLTLNAKTGKTINFAINGVDGVVMGASSVAIGAAGSLQGTMTLAGVTSGVVTVAVAAAAGTWTLTLPTAVGSAGEQLTDAGGDGITSWAGAGSRREVKRDIVEWDRPRDALDLILDTRVSRFYYREGHGTKDTATEYVGPMANEAPWAMHYGETMVNPVNTLGFMILGFRAMQDEIEGLKAQLEAARR